jgi:hypothetical protein
MDSARPIIFLGSFALLFSVVLVVGSLVAHILGVPGMTEVLVPGVLFNFIGVITVKSGQALRELSERIQRLEAQLIAQTQA